MCDLPHLVLTDVGVLAPVCVVAAGVCSGSSEQEECEEVHG
jgi:hypothetical protein